MSTLSKRNPESSIGREWRRWRYHLSALLVVLPFFYTPHYLRMTATFRGETEGLPSYGPFTVGPWTVRIYDIPFMPTSSQGPAGEGRQIIVEPCAPCAKQIRAIFLRIGKPRSARAYGAPAGGNPYRGRALLLIPPRATPDDELWLTAEGWDGSVHQSSVPLAQASPSIVAWLKNRGGPQ